MKGFTVEIYRNDYKSILNVLGENNTGTLLDPKFPAMDEPSESAPALVLVKRVLFGKEYTHAQPAAPGSYAFGGSFIWSSDSRFREISEAPIPLHDRNMSLESGPINCVKVHFANNAFDYCTSVSNQSTPQSAAHYFLGKHFNLGAYPVEDMQQCTGITFINKVTGKEITFSI